ncbi:RNA polymerase factor sigma-54 [Bacillus sp. MRMR6]|uniref:RNA polymerase factor sigma-54 n=1 Tax=Bacillus sp. MRMR6 TaxID=1928617 RepID=UPI000953043B|nr:RNA polymerase factor sigma-54 [Bacillus sp. MRMR6]OLS35248.1 RNA polymerase sigma-54 factor [Bacillus sp. MRMR6]
MDLKAGLWQQQTLKLAMTQELTQAIALLQYSSQELTEFLDSKALENPLLEIDHQNIKPINPLVDRNRNRTRSNIKNTETKWIEQIASKSTTIEEQLMSQLNINAFSSKQLQVIRYIIQTMDGNGYITETLEQIAEKMKLSVELVEDCLIAIQTLEPAGIGARNLQECLLIQIERENSANDLAQTILTNYFVPFAEKKWKQITKELHVTLQEIQEVSDWIQKLNPRPGACLEQDETKYIIPDAIVEKSDMQFSIRLCDDLLPRIRFNASYYKQFSSKKDAQLGKFLQEKQQDFQWIMKSIEQRKETLIKVVTKIVERQTMFFEKGPNYLLPMTMKDLSSELDIHESTVSRAVREKYVQTPMGTFPLKYFFTSTIQTVSNESTSSSQVKNAIHSLIERENKQKPLSDQEIAEHLKNQEGMVVSRRTVAKYREQLGILSSSKRKRFD